MNALHTELSGFAMAIVHGEAPSPHIIAMPNYSVAAGLEVYRNNYRGNLQDALAGTYPVIEQLVGKDFFRMMARHFIERHPSRSANLHHYGAELADFLAGFSPAQALVYLPDIAALEWACHVAYFAPDEPAFDLARLAQVPPGDYSNLTLRIHPACQIVRSRHPITAIWQAHQPGMDSNFHIDLDRAPGIALVSRQHDVVNVSELDPADALWLQSIMAGKMLGDATAATLDRCPDFNLQSALIKLVALDVLSDFTLAEKS